MRRLSFLLLGLALVLVGVHVVTGAGAFAAYLLRDGLLVAGAGVIVFAWSANTWRATTPLRRTTALAHVGELLAVTGIVTALVAGTAAGLGLTGILAQVIWFAWGLGLILLVAGAWWPGGAVEYSQPALRWEKDAQGAPVPVPIGAPRPAAPAARLLSGRAAALWWLAILAAAAVLRLWNLTALPPGCVAGECIDGLRLVDGQPFVGAAGAFHLFENLARLAYALTGASVLSLRLAAGVLGLVTVGVFYFAARRLTAPINALLAMLLLALSPWHLWASRSSDPWVLAALLATLALWLTLEALAHGSLRWWALAGLSQALLFVETPPLRPAVALWLLVALGAGAVLVWRRPPTFARVTALAGGGLAALAAALPVLVAGLRSGDLWAAPGGSGLTANLTALLGALLRPDAAPATPFATAGLLAGFTLALAAVGGGVLLRHVRQPAAVFVLAGIALFFFFLARQDLNTLSPAAGLLAVLPLLLAGAAAAIDQLMDALLRAWGRVVNPTRLAAVTAVGLALLLLWNTSAFMADLDHIESGSGGQMETDVARFLARWQLDHPNDQTVFVAPAAVINHPSVRLLAGPALAAGRLQPLELGRTLPYTQPAAGDLLYLLPAADTQIVALLKQLYPAGAVHTQLSEAGDRTLFNTFQAPQAAVSAGQGLQMLVFAGQQPAAQPAQSTVVTALDFPWATQPPFPSPFSAQWLGSLVVPAAGSYQFSVEHSAPDAQFSLKLDDLLVLDTAAGVTQQSLPLAQGVYRVDMQYHSGAAPGDLRVRWQPPDAGQPEVIGQTALHTPALPNEGLMGDYYPNNRFEGMTVTQRKDLFPGLLAGVPQPFSVHWQGKLAAPRAGEYLIGAASDGPSQVKIDGRQLVDTTNAGAQPQAVTGLYGEGLIYLPAGWHDIDVRYTPAGPAPQFRLLWQPAGSQAGELTSQYLRPTVGEMGPADAQLPPPPPLADPALGNDQFALNKVTTALETPVRIAPENLQPLPVEALWKVGNGCGAGDQQLAAPHGVAISALDNRIYVADTGNRRVQIFTIDGAHAGSVADPAFQEPVDIDFAPGGAPLVLDAVAQQVFRLEANGAVTPLALNTGFYRPRGFAVDNSGNLVVADTGGARLAVMAPDGPAAYKAAGEFGGRDSLLGRGQPVDALLSNGMLWAVSAEDGRLWNIYADGSLTGLQPTNTINGPKLAALGDGYFLLTNPAKGSFTVFTPAGQPVQGFDYPGQLVTPTGIAALPAGDHFLIAVADSTTCTLSLWKLPRDVIIHP